MRDLAANRNLPPLANFEIWQESDNGTPTLIDSGFGNAATRRLYDNASGAAIVARLTAQIAKNTEFKPIEVSAERGLQYSPVVIVQAQDPAAVVSNSTRPEFWASVLGNYAGYEGYYLEFRGPDGEPFLISTTAHRAGSSASWLRPDFGCSSTFIYCDPAALKAQSR